MLKGEQIYSFLCEVVLIPPQYDLRILVLLNRVMHSVHFPTAITTQPKSLCFYVPWPLDGTEV